MFSEDTIPADQRPARRVVGHRPYGLALAEAQRAHALTPLLRDRILAAVRIAA
jgi:hypothetical protein